MMLAALSLGACNGASHADAGTEPAEIAQARLLVQADAALPPRAEALVVAQSVEARAVKEGAGARATELHTLAGTLFERVYRLEGKDQDAKEAQAAYEAASKDLKIPGACDAALRGAALAGDAGHDAQVSYIAFYKLSRRSEACGGRAAAAMATLEAFRPAPRVLDAIDRGLEAQGTVLDSDAAAPTHAEAFLERVEHWPGKDAARIVVTLSREAKFHASDEIATKDTPQRIFVDFDGARRGRA